MPTATRTAAEILDDYFDGNARRAAELLALEADLAVAAAFDDARAARSHDVGVGRRERALDRIERRVAELGGRTDLLHLADELKRTDAGIAELHRAWARRQADARRAFRALAERPTPARRAAVTAWEDTADTLDLTLDA